VQFKIIMFIICFFGFDISKACHRNNCTYTSSKDFCLSNFLKFSSTADEVCEFFEVWEDLSQYKEILEYLSACLKKGYFNCPDWEIKHRVLLENLEKCFCKDSNDATSVGIWSSKRSKNLMTAIASRLSCLDKLERSFRV